MIQSIPRINTQNIVPTIGPNKTFHQSFPLAITATNAKQIVNSQKRCGSKSSNFQRCSTKGCRICLSFLNRCLIYSGLLVVSTPSQNPRNSKRGQQSCYPTTYVNSSWSSVRWAWRLLLAPTHLADGGGEVVGCWLIDLNISSSSCSVGGLSPVRSIVLPVEGSVTV
jgi:hypothetical protein